MHSPLTCSCAGVSCVAWDLRQGVSPLIPLRAVLRYAWLGADYFVLFWGVDFGHGQAVSSLVLLNAVLRYAWLGADYFVLLLGRRFRPWTGGKFPGAAECSAQVCMAWC